MRINLEGEANFRDLGGFVGKNGRKIRKGMLFRSGELSRLTDKDLTCIQKLGIRNVIDLRTDIERSAKPNRLPPQVDEFHLPLLAELGADSLEGLLQQILEGKIRAFNYMIEIYCSFEEIKLRNWKRLFALLSEGESTLWHCTAGKDRTGMTTALVLEALGVSRGVILEDYMKTNEYAAIGIDVMVRNFRTKFGDIMAEKLLDLVTVKDEYLGAFWDSMNARFGGADEFFKVVGLNPSVLQEKYLET